MTFARHLLHRRVVVCGRAWVVAAVIEQPGFPEHPWCWLVREARPTEQARYPARALMEGAGCG